MARDSENLLSVLGGSSPGPPVCTLICPGTGQNAPTDTSVPRPLPLGRTQSWPFLPPRVLLLLFLGTRLARPLVLLASSGKLLAGASPPHLSPQPHHWPLPSTVHRMGSVVLLPASAAGGWAPGPRSPVTTRTPRLPPAPLGHSPQGPKAAFSTLFALGVLPFPP